MNLKTQDIKKVLKPQDIKETKNRISVILNKEMETRYRVVQTIPYNSYQKYKGQGTRYKGKEGTKHYRGARGILCRTSAKATKSTKLHRYQMQRWHREHAGTHRYLYTSTYVGTSIYLYTKSTKLHRYQGYRGGT